MTTALLAAAPPAKDSAPNKKEWKDEIHTPAAEYNANLPIADIAPDPKNRKDHDPVLLKELADQIADQGLLQPILVRPLKNGAFQIIAGERRYLAHKILKRLTIRAFIHKDETDLSHATKQLLENEGREDLNPIERARGYQRQIDLGMKQKDLVELLKKSQPVISNTLRLLELPESVQQLVASGELSHAHGVALVRWAKWPKACMCIARMVIDHDYDAKSINVHSVPFAGTLEQEKLVERIHVDKGYSWETRPTYVIPASLKSDPAFINDHGDYVYMLPEDPKANKWAPEKERQDKERAAAEAKKKTPAPDGKKTPEQKARAKKIADNKAARAKIDEGLQDVIDRLKAVKGIDGAALALIAQKACPGESPEEAAEMLGIKVPKGFDDYDPASWAKLAPGDAVRITAITIAVARAHEASRFASEVPDEIEFLRKGGKTK